jgi:FkbM family methyltransferase
MFSGIFQSEEEGAFVDIGANVGMFTLLAASLGRKVYAVEPTKPTLANLKGSVRANDFEKLVTVYGFIVGDAVSTAAMDPYGKSVGGTQVSRKKDGGGGGLNVPMMPLDLLPLPKNILLMKVDVEGFEGRLIMGASETLKRVKYLTLEYSSKRLEKLDCNGYNYVDAILANGFTMVDRLDRQRRPVDVAQWKETKGKHEVTDIYFVRLQSQSQ